MDEIQCPNCGSKKWNCWDERQLDWWDKDGAMAATQVIGCLNCADCNHPYADVSPSDAELREAGLWCDEEEQNTIYRIGWR